jgi:hypothetical protein
VASEDSTRRPAMILRWPGVILHCGAWFKIKKSTLLTFLKENLPIDTPLLVLVSHTLKINNN